MKPLGCEAGRQSPGMCGYTEHRGLESCLISGRHRCPPPCQRSSALMASRAVSPGLSVHPSCMVMGFLCLLLLLILSSLCQYVFVRLLSSGGVRSKVEDEENRGRDSVLARDLLTSHSSLQQAGPTQEPQPQYEEKLV